LYGDDNQTRAELGLTRLLSYIRGSEGWLKHPYEVTLAEIEENVDPSQGHSG
jgi:hypothetical protein